MNCTSSFSGKCDKYKSPYEISVGDVVSMKDDTGYVTEHLVITNYIKGETDAKGFTPKTNFTILVDNYGKKTAITDYRELDVLVNINDYRKLDVLTKINEN